MQRLLVASLLLCATALPSGEERRHRPLQPALSANASCVSCSDKASDYLNSEKRSCKAAVRALQEQEQREKCTGPWGNFAFNGLCQRSCYEAGWGYVQCCEEEGAADSHGLQAADLNSGDCPCGRVAKYVEMAGAIFVHIPKTGGTSVEDAILQEGQLGALEDACHYKAVHLRECDKAAWATLPSFASWS